MRQTKAQKDHPRKDSISKESTSSRDNSKSKPESFGDYYSRMERESDATMLRTLQSLVQVREANKASKSVRESFSDRYSRIERESDDLMIQSLKSLSFHRRKK